MYNIRPFIKLSWFLNIMLNLPTTNMSYKVLAVKFLQHELINRPLSKVPVQNCTFSCEVSLTRVSHCQPASSACRKGVVPPNAARKKGQIQQIPSTWSPLTWSENFDQTPPSKKVIRLRKRSTFHEDKGKMARQVMRKCSGRDSGGKVPDVITPSKWQSSPCE